jgi:hypothetical protein
VADQLLGAVLVHADGLHDCTKNESSLSKRTKGFFSGSSHFEEPRECPRVQTQIDLDTGSPVKGSEMVSKLCWIVLGGEISRFFYSLKALTMSSETFCFVLKIKSPESSRLLSSKLTLRGLPAFARVAVQSVARTGGLFVWRKPCGTPSLRDELQLGFKVQQLSRWQTLLVCNEKRSSSHCFFNLTLSEYWSSYFS